MQNFIIFISIFYFCLLSVISYGHIFQRICFNKIKKDENNLIYLGFHGLMFITLISLVSSIFFKHNFFHNLLIHSFGFIYFFFSSIKKEKTFLKYILIISLLIFSLLLISKTNDDLSYYHLPFTKYLTENKIIFGMGHLNHGYNLLSSLFFLNSTFYLPFVELYSFHFSLLFFLIFFNYFLLSEIYSKKNNDIIKYLYLFSFLFFNISFNRIAEFGTDKVGQLLIVLLVIKLFDLVCFDEKNKKIEKILFLLPLLAFCISLKTYFLPYLALSFVLFFFNNERIKSFNFILYSRSCIFFLLILFFNFTHHFISTGCIISPIPFTCFGDTLLWAREISHINNLANWLEQWAKAGAGPNFRVDDPLIYIQNFNWFPNWIINYFTGKFVDQILILIVVILITIFIFKSTSVKKNTNLNKKNCFFYYSILLIIFYIWFSNHPTLRYGGYSIFFLIVAIPTSLIINNFKDKNFFNKKFSFLIILVVIILNFKNFDRIVNEFNREDMFKYKNFPFFSIHSPKFTKKKFENNLIMYSSQGHCWSTPTPCGNTTNIKVIKKNGYYFLNTDK